METRTFSVVFDSDLEKVKAVVNEAAMFLNEIFPALTKETAFETKLVLNEALINAVIHGNEQNSGKKVSLDIMKHDNSSILIQVADEGDGFDYRAVCVELTNIASRMKESGRGIKLVSSLADEVHFNKQGNKIKIYKKVVSNG